MQINQLLGCVISPALKLINKNSPAAIALIAGTAAQESRLGEYIIQTNYNYNTDIQKFKGAYGIYQQERISHDDVVDRYLSRDKCTSQIIYANFGATNVEKLIYDLRYATIMCRLHYYLIPQAIPEHTNIQGMAEYYKNHYNTAGGAATVAQFIDNYKKLILPEIGKFLGACSN